jgi:hypothetical protein
VFAAIRYYQADPPSIDEVVRRVQEDFVPLIRDMAAEWVVQNLSELLRPTPEFASGQVVVYEASQ